MATAVEYCVKTSDLMTRFGVLLNLGEESVCMNLASPLYVPTSDMAYI